MADGTRFPSVQGAAPLRTSLWALFERAARERPDDPWLSAGGVSHTLTQTAQRVGALAKAGVRAGFGPRVRVAGVMGNHADHVAAILALARTGAVWVPLDTRAPAAALMRRIAAAKITAALADVAGAALLRAGGFEGAIIDPAEVADDGGAAAPAPPRAPSDWRAILFTSGTTGPPKGVIVTEAMMGAAGAFAARAARAGPGETFLLWEPLNHIGGAQMIPAALQSGARLAMVPRFSASRFWDEAKAAGATRIHYLGGVLDLLAKQPERASDRDHRVTLAFGAAAKPAMWGLFKERFGVALIEVYGQTEASSFCVMNEDGVPGAIGRPLDGFEVALRGADGRVLADGPGEGEMLLRATREGLMTPGYLDAPDATAAAFAHGSFRTGDLAHRDADGLLWFRGRVKEAIRRRGENVSAQEVEGVVAEFAGVEECAVVGVPAEVGEEDILAVVTLVGDAPFDPAALRRFCAERLPPSHLPRFVRVVSALPRTPSERIAKAEIARRTDGDWDGEARP